MNLSKAEQAELDKLSEKHPVVKKLMEEVKSFYEDPSKIYFKAVKDMSVALAKELDLARAGKSEGLFILGSDDKLFERIDKLMTGSEKYFAGIKKGQEYIDPNFVPVDEKKEEKKGVVI